mgnify:CR=1 FL=1
MLSFYQNQWEAYVGLPQEEVVQIFETVLKQEKETYKKESKPPIYIYDSSHDQVILTLEELNIAIIYVSADPLTRFFSTVLGTRRHMKGISYLSISYHPQSKHKLHHYLNLFQKKSPSEPWKIMKHPRFQFAFLLQLLNKRKWTKAGNPNT